jgi:alpha-beta hydrolase superfamily lysophospholipase
MPPMIDRFREFPRALAEQARAVRLGDVPVMLAHPNWERPAPVMLWMHGRTVTKELDPGRYLRMIRAGIGVCAIDLPGHGERFRPEAQTPAAALDVVATMASELDGIVEHLAAVPYGNVFDLDRMGIGGMSAGGMATLIRLCTPHPFAAACVEGSSGWLAGLQEAREGGSLAGGWDPALVARLDPIGRLDGFRPVPILFLHASEDAVVPWEVQSRFVDALRARYSQAGAAGDLIEVVTYPRTGALNEHAGFGTFSNDAKNAQVDFLARRLGAR